MCLPENPVFLEIWLIPWYFQFILNKIRLHSFKKNWFFGIKLFSLNPANLKRVLGILIKFSMNPARFSTLFFLNSELKSEFPKFLNCGLLLLLKWVLKSERPDFHKSGFYSSFSSWPRNLDSSEKPLKFSAGSQVVRLVDIFHKKISFILT